MAAIEATASALWDSVASEDAHRHESLTNSIAWSTYCVLTQWRWLGFNNVGLTHESLEYSLGVDYAIYSHDLHPPSTCLSHMETQATACPQCCLAPGLFLQPPTPSTAGSRIVHGNLA